MGREMTGANISLNQPMRYLIFLALLSASCAAKQSFTGTDPLPEFEPYVASFEAAYGRPLPAIVYLFEDLEPNAAQCAISGPARIISVDENRWATLCDAQKKAVIWHELGHCVLHRDHTNDGDPISYMNAALRSCEYFEANEEELDSEMFQQ